MDRRHRRRPRRRAGGAAFYLINQAQQQAGQAGLQRRPSSSPCRRSRPARSSRPTDVEVREIPLDDTNAEAIVLDGRQGHRAGAGGRSCRARWSRPTCSPRATRAGQFSILGPSRRSPRTPRPWRAISMTVPDDRAVGGMLDAEPDRRRLRDRERQRPHDSGRLDGRHYYTDKSTKITYQNMVILAKAGTFYVLKAPLDVAEEISHLQASGQRAAFSMALRPTSTPGRSTRQARRHDHEPVIIATGCRSRSYPDRATGRSRRRRHPTRSPPSPSDPTADAARRRRPLAAASPSSPPVEQARVQPAIPRRAADPGASGAPPRLPGPLRRSPVAVVTRAPPIAGGSGRRSRRARCRDSAASTSPCR